VARFATPAEFLLALESDDSPAQGAEGFEREFGGAIEQPFRVEPKPRPPEKRHYWPTAIIFLVAVAVALALVAQPQLLDTVRGFLTPGDGPDETPAVVDTAGPGDASRTAVPPGDAAIEDGSGA